MKPRRVEPKEFGRWVKSALLLLRQKQSSWIAIAAFGAIASVLTDVSTICQVFVLLCLMMLSVDFAGTVDAHSAPSLKELPSWGVHALRTALPSAVYCLAIMIAVFSITTIIQGTYQDAIKVLYKETTLLNLSSTPGLYFWAVSVSAAVGIACINCIVLLHSPFAHGIFSYLLRRKFGYTKAEAHSLEVEGVKKNVKPLMKLVGFLFLVAIVGSTLAPLASLIALFGFSATLFWVAFKDIFLHDTFIDETK